jgi:hypothetical protein
MADMSPALPPEVVAYIHHAEQQRADQVRATVAAMTPREQALVREIAVMAYVRGRLAGWDSSQPPDSAVLAEAVTGCLHMPDLYPTVNSLTEGRADG